MNTWASGVLDRAVRTGLQTLLAYLSAAQLINQVAWVPALSATGFAVVLSLITSAMSSPSWGESWVFQLAERAVKTFLQSVVAFIGTASLFDQVDWRTGFSAAALATVYSIVTSVLTTRTGSADTVGQVDLTAPANSRRAHLSPA
jgi:hypothetical protein